MSEKEIKQSSEEIISELNKQIIELKKANSELSEKLNLINKDDNSAQINQNKTIQEQKELYFKDLANKAPVMIWLTDSEGQCIYVNKQWCEFTGTEFTSNFNRGWVSCIYPDDVEMALEAFFKAGKNYESFSINYRLKRFDGVYRWMSISGAPRFENGVFLGYIGSIVDIDDIKQAENKIKESENIFMALAETIPNFVWMADALGNVNYHNKRFLEYVGLSFDEVKNWGWKVFIHPEDLDECIRLWKISLTTGSPFEFKSRYKNGETGQYRWFLARALPLYDNDNNIIQWYGTCSDIQEQIESGRVLESLIKKRTKELNSEKNKLNNLFMNAPALISMMYGPDLVYEFSNHKHHQTIHKDLMGKSLYESRPELKNSGYLEILEEVYKTGIPFFGNELPADIGDNKEHYYNFVYQPIFNENNQVEGISTFAFEVTDHVLSRKKLEMMTEELSESKLKYKILAENLEKIVHERTIALTDVNKELDSERYKLNSLLMSAPAIINLFKGSEHIFELVNPLFQALYPEIDFIGKTVREAQPELEGQGFYELLDQVYSTGEPFIGNEVLVNIKDGNGLKEAYFNFIYQPIFDINQKVYGISSFAYDVSEQVISRKRIEKLVETLEHTNKELKRSNDELQQFAYIASHDLRSPLRSISGYMEILNRRYKDSLDETANEFISSAISGAKKMQNLIDDLLDYSKVSAFDLYMTDIDCNEVMEQTLLNLKSEIEEKNAVIKYEHLPVVKGKNTLLIRLFQNLISNSIKFNKKSPLIDVAVKKVDNEWIFSITDNGIGISDEHKTKIFQIFQRLHTDSEYLGTGIGLSVCKKIVEKHNGRIWLESEKDKGTVFFFTLPA